jgi:hypothetical protein
MKKLLVAMAAFACITALSVSAAEKEKQKLTDEQKLSGSR